MKLLAAIFLASHLGSAVAAETWKVVAKNRKTENLVDVQSITRHKNLIEYWDKILYAVPQALSDGTHFAQLRSIGTVNCARQTIATNYLASYDANGKLINFVRGTMAFEQATSGTRAEKIVRFLCSGSFGVGGAQRRLASPHADMPKSRLDTIIARTTIETGLEQGLLKAVIAAESGYNPTAISRAGAKGLMQLMPETARRFGVTDIFDPEQNIRAGAKYLSYLLHLFKGDLSLAIAAYNAGENSVIKYGNKIPPYRETRKYVPIVLGYLKHYQHNQ